MRDFFDRLKTLREREIISDIDLELCRFLQDQHPNISPKVLLAACLVSYLYRQGNVCIQLSMYASRPIFEEVEDPVNINGPELRGWKQSLSSSAVVGGPGDFKPLILDSNGRLYMHKLWQYEHRLAEQLIKRSQKQNPDIDLELLREGLKRLFGEESTEVDWQKVAAASAVKNKLSIISGGPGTGKTTTIVRVLALLLEQTKRQNENPNIALTAPTGKAAARLKDSILEAKGALNVSEEIRSAIPEDAITLHQLMGARKHSSSFKHDDENPLPHDVIIVDEASMVDQALMSKLIQALLEDTRLILLGDKDQLASVEAGSVLGDICDIDTNSFSEERSDWFGGLSLQIPDKSITDNPKPLTDNIILLTKSYRFEEKSGISQLASAINSGRAGHAVEVLNSLDYDHVSLNEITDQPALEAEFKKQVTEYFRQVVQAESADQALRSFNKFRILAAHRRGPWGVEYLNQLVENILQQEGVIPKYKRWYPGKPIIINVNDYGLGLHNGDTGVCLPNEDGTMQVYFRHENSVRPIAPGRLPDYSRAFALTVHKSQGSEFDKVLLVLPDAPSKVLSRELIYTAVSRARTKINILGNESVINRTIERQIQRSSGLKDALW